MGLERVEDATREGRGADVGAVVLGEGEDIKEESDDEGRLTVIRFCIGG